MLNRYMDQMITDKDEQEPVKQWMRHRGVECENPLRFLMIDRRQDEAERRSYVSVEMMQSEPLSPQTLNELP